MIGLSAAAATSQADNLTTLVDAGSGPATLTIYDGDRPDTPDDTPTGTALAVFTLADPSAAAAVAGLITWDYASAPAAATVAADGVPAWFRVSDSDGNPVFDGDAAGDGGDMDGAAGQWVAGESVDFTGGTVAYQVG